uniref:NAD(P)H oxidase 2 n=1 Tax=Asparagopsis taxiformis TaxID=260499 RepID=A0A6M8QCB9_9FLOR|nr:NAD(P)H oxidase 2 [Asparagopsis taxiformis]
MATPWGKRSVSATESILSTHGFVYTFVGLYLIGNILLFVNAAREEGKLHEDFEKYTTSIARGAAATINLNMAVVLLVASKSVIGFLRETAFNLALPIDKAMPEFHAMVGILVVSAGIIHSILQWVVYIIKSPWGEGFSGGTFLFISGMVLLVLLITMRVFARTAIYNANFEVFFRVHVGGGIISFITVLIHGQHRGEAQTWKWLIGAIIIYVLDLGFRAFREKRSYLLVSKHSAAFQGSGIIKIRLPRVFHFQAGQYAELKVPILSRFQWHPFTIASAPHEPEMVFYVKAVGDWTISFLQLFRERIRDGTEGDIEVHIRGPFGASSQHVGQFDRVILVGGGVGATPFCSVVKDAYNWMTNWAPNVSKRDRTRRRNPPKLEKLSLRPEQSEGLEVQQESSQESDETSWDYDSAEISKHTRITHGSREASSHIITTNVFSENLDSFATATDGRAPGGNTIQSIETQPSQQTWTSNLKRTRRRELDPWDSMEEGTIRELSLYTARDYLVMAETNTNAESTCDFSGNRNMNIPLDRHNDLNSTILEDRIQPQDSRRIPTEIKPHNNPRSKFSDRFSRTSRRVVDQGMGTFRENSKGSHRPSLDYISALHSAYSERQNDEVYQQSLNMMVSLSFGSVSLVRNMQVKKATRVKQASNEVVPFSVDKDDLSLFKNPRIMFILFMRSVTINMTLLWILLIRFIIAGFAHVFDNLRLFSDGIALYESSSLIIIDLVLSLLVTVLVAIPSVLEIVELGAAPVHGFDLFVLVPAAFFGVVTDLLALLGIGKNVNLFSALNVFALWPILGILVIIRLLRVIGERIAYAENRTSTHSNTKAVDFYWTAPNAEDDRWLVNELSAYTDMDSVKMHRYLTRCVEQERNGARHGSAIRTNLGRPDWDSIFNNIARTSRNNSTIGVFFCGPTSMGEEVQDAVMNAMRNSIVRGLRCGVGALRGLEEVFGDQITANEYTVENSKGKEQLQRGCNVKMVFKRESFS